jgi:hypothetical protein
MVRDTLIMPNPPNDDDDEPTHGLSEDRELVLV